MADTPERKTYTFKYDKLVRDRLPDIIRSEGWDIKQQVLSPTAFKKALRKKILEEVEEFLETKDRVQALAELADVQEVIEALVRSEGYTMSELLQAQRDKKKWVGAYEKKVKISSITYRPGADKTWLKYHLKNQKKFPLIK